MSEGNTRWLQKGEEGGKWSKEMKIWAVNSRKRGGDRIREELEKSEGTQGKS